MVNFIMTVMVVCAAVFWLVVIGRMIYILATWKDRKVISVQVVYEGDLTDVPEEY